MAKEDKAKVTRITAGDGDGTERKKLKVKNPSVATSKKEKRIKSGRKKRSFGPLGAFLGYFKGAWYELRQVRWPTRRATWGLTGAVLLFSAFFLVFISLLDAGFKFLFEQILR